MRNIDRPEVIEALAEVLDTNLMLEFNEKHGYFQANEFSKGFAEWKNWLTAEYVEPKKWSEDDLKFAELIRKQWEQFKWIARDSNGRVSLYICKPRRFYNAWLKTADKYGNLEIPLDITYMFTTEWKAIKWEDEEPTLIADIVEERK